FEVPVPLTDNEPTDLPMEHVTRDLSSWMVIAGFGLGAVLLAIILHRIVFALGRRLTRQAGIVEKSLVRHGQRPAALILPALALFLVASALPMPSYVKTPTTHILLLVLIGSLAWLLIALSRVINDLLDAKYRVGERDNLRARQVQTQVQVFRHVGGAILGMVTLGIMLMTFPQIRSLGTSIFASAGLAGVVLGLAARPAFSSIIAGIQLALTEPIRLDDVVIVEGEWGWIEEIRTTYVVVRIWDLRRLIVPVSYFIEQPFQNWTRQTADILGTVFIHTDYTVPVEELRQELHRVLESSDMWDGKAWGLQVTDADAQTMELRALMSAPDSSTAWNLRCLVRERLITYLQGHYPECLPRVRAEIGGRPAGPEAKEATDDPVSPVPKAPSH
ncbi:MAG: mechanosensitive ion channel family protein, partial [Acidobacteriota bacterium]